MSLKIAHFPLSMIRNLLMLWNFLLNFLIQTNPIEVVIKIIAVIIVQTCKCTVGGPILGTPSPPSPQGEWVHKYSEGKIKDYHPIVLHMEFVLP